ncbi:MAG: NAD(P)/FAD-dependent oxidoreductase [Pseudanabaenaceae cyanobacterium SKYGB_i_bin29]|nr:FAD-dependent oxidoreductase [Pseudanabaenaceae cyanobacterium SKYG29]MDW8421599.1 NAD(P)/FAD-dependent oxidoreductase [Pseudanabaenaceae cyanobacterium SKYGB_i_bin29]
MGRTPLWRFLRRAYRLARREAGISRRRTLQLGLFAGGFLATSALHSCSQPPWVRRDDPILIVGAGIAGLTAAYRLWQKQVPIKILEASDRVGGRIFSLNNALSTTQTAELGGEFINSDHQNIRTLVEEMELELVDLYKADEKVEDEIWFFNGKKITFADVAQAFMPLAQQVVKDRAAIGGYSYQHSNPIAQKLDRLSIADYLKQYTRNPVLEELLSVAYTIEYGREVEEQSSFNLIVLLGDDEESAILGESDERYTIRGGNQQLPQRLAEKLSNFIELNSYVESIRRSPDGRYQVSWRRDNASKQSSFSRVVLAIPFTVLRTIDLRVNLPPLKLRAIRELGYGYNAKLITSYRERLWRTKYQSNGKVYTDLRWQHTWETGKYAPTTTGLITNYMGGNRCLQLSTNPSQEAQAFLQSFATVFPGIDQVYHQSLLINWYKLPLARASYSGYLVGQTTLFGGIEGEPFQNLFFAGEHCSPDYQGYMEGACASGNRVAELIPTS